MADGDQTPTRADSIFTNPWPAIAIGFVAESAAFCCFRLYGREILPLVLFGLLAAGVGVSIRPQSWIVLSLAAASSMLARAATSPEWDSARLLMATLSIVAGVAALLMLLPCGLRRLVVSFLILLHLGGIGTMVTRSHGFWLPHLLWIHFYRPYLELTFQIESYTYYSPDPGPT